MSIILSFLTKNAFNYAFYIVAGGVAAVSVYYIASNHFENKVLIKSALTFQEKVRELEKHETALEKKYHATLDKLNKKRESNEKEIRKIDSSWSNTKLPSGAIGVLSEKC